MQHVLLFNTAGRLQPTDLHGVEDSVTRSRALTLTFNAFASSVRVHMSLNRKLRGAILANFGEYPAIWEDGGEYYCDGIVVGARRDRYDAMRPMYDRAGLAALTRRWERCVEGVGAEGPSGVA